MADESSNSERRGAAKMVLLGRAFLLFSFIALVGAWVSEFTGGAFGGFSQQHLFFDSITLSLLGIGAMVDAFWHARGE